MARGHPYEVWSPPDPSSDDRLRVITATDLGDVVDLHFHYARLGTGWTLARALRMWGLRETVLVTSGSGREEHLWALPKARARVVLDSRRKMWERGGWKCLGTTHIGG